MNSAVLVLPLYPPIETSTVDVDPDAPVDTDPDVAAPETGRIVFLGTSQTERSVLPENASMGQESLKGLDAETIQSLEFVLEETVIDSEAVEDDSQISVSMSSETSKNLVPENSTGKDPGTSVDKEKSSDVDSMMIEGDPSVKSRGVRSHSSKSKSPKVLKSKNVDTMKSKSAKPVKSKSVDSVKSVGIKSEKCKRTKPVKSKSVDMIISKNNDSEKPESANSQESAVVNPESSRMDSATNMDLENSESVHAENSIDGDSENSVSVNQETFRGFDLETSSVEKSKGVNSNISARTDAEKSACKDSEKSTSKNCEKSTSEDRGNSANRAAQTKPYARKLTIPVVNQVRVPALLKESGIELKLFTRRNYRLEAKIFALYDIMLDLRDKCSLSEKCRPCVLETVKEIESCEHWKEVEDRVSYSALEKELTPNEKSLMTTLLEVKRKRVRLENAKLKHDWMKKKSFVLKDMTEKLLGILKSESINASIMNQLKKWRINKKRAKSNSKPAGKRKKNCDSDDEDEDDRDQAADSDDSDTTVAGKLKELNSIEKPLDQYFKGKEEQRLRREEELKNKRLVELEKKKLETEEKKVEMEERKRQRELEKEREEREFQELMEKAKKLEEEKKIRRESLAERRRLQAEESRLQIEEMENMHLFKEKEKEYASLGVIKKCTVVVKGTERALADTKKQIKKRSRNEQNIAPKNNKGPSTGKKHVEVQSGRRPVVIQYHSNRGESASRNHINAAEVHAGFNTAPEGSTVERRYIGTICRLCAETNNEVVFVFDESKVDILNKIHTYLPVEIREDDELPKTVCMKCVGKLYICHSIIQGCVVADATLRRMYGIPQRDQIDVEEIDIKPCIDEMNSEEGTETQRNEQAEEDPQAMIDRIFQEQFGDQTNEDNMAATEPPRAKQPRLDFSKHEASPKEKPRIQNIPMIRRIQVADWAKIDKTQTSSSLLSSAPVPVNKKNVVSNDTRERSVLKIGYRGNGATDQSTPNSGPASGLPNRLKDVPLQPNQTYLVVNNQVEPQRATEAALNKIEPVVVGKQSGTPPNQFLIIGNNVAQRLLYSNQQGVGVLNQSVMLANQHGSLIGTPSGQTVMLGVVGSSQSAVVGSQQNVLIRNPSTVIKSPEDKSMAVGSAVNPQNHVQLKFPPKVERTEYEEVITPDHIYTLDPHKIKKEESLCNKCGRLFIDLVAMAAHSCRH